MKKRWASLAAAVLMLAAGCGKNAAPEEAPVIPDHLAVSIGGEPQTLDPGRYSSTEEATLIGHLFESLTREDANGTVSGGAAESWNEELKGEQVKRPVYTFKLRKDACWSDGNPVKAKDFVYAWKRVISGKADSPYAYLFNIIYNAMDYAAGKEAALGLAAPDDTTLEVTLEGECAYFPLLVSLPVFAPVREDIAEAGEGDWSAAPATCIGNGAYRLSEWVHDDHLSLAKNSAYRASGNAAGMDIAFRFLDENACKTAFEQGELQAAYFAGNGAATLDCPTGLSYYYAVNTDHITDTKVRLALSEALDRAALVKELGLTAREAVLSLTGTDVSLAEDAASAKESLSAGGKIPDKLVLLTNTTTGGVDDVNTRLANAAAKRWQNVLGITVEVKALPYDEFLKAREAGEYDLVRCGSAADFDDPAALLGLFSSGAKNNAARYSSTKYTTLMRDSSKEMDTSVRAGKLADAEHLLIVEDAAVIPLMRGVGTLQMSAELSGVSVNGIGQLDFSAAEIAQKQG